MKPFNWKPRLVKDVLKDICARRRQAQFRHVNEKHPELVKRGRPVKKRRVGGQEKPKSSTETVLALDEQAMEDLVQSEERYVVCNVYIIFANI